MTTSAALPYSTEHATAWNTPQVLWRALWAIWVCDALLLAALLFAGRVHQAALASVGHDAVPSIIAAETIKSSLADMDADAASELLADPGSISASNRAYLQNRQRAAVALIAAAQNIKYGEKERKPILDIQIGLEKYEALLQHARDLRDEHNAAFLTAYDQAADVLDSTVLKAADALDEENASELEAAYSRQGAASLSSRFQVSLAALALLAVLILSQGYLYRRTRRVFNLPLLAASLLIALAVLTALHNLAATQNDLLRAKDAFTSIHALWKGSSVSYSANADERRMLLDPGHAKQWSADFSTKLDSLAKIPSDATYESEAQFVPPNAVDSGFTGYLADEMKNIAAPNERESASKMLVALGQYVQIDRQVQDLERRGQHSQAAALAEGTAQGQAEFAFEQFHGALADTLQIDQAAFDSYIAAGFGALDRFDAGALAAAGIIAMFALLGFLPRIREYR